MKVIRTLTLLITMSVIVCVAAAGYFVATGVSARDQPGKVETMVARGVRRVAIRAHADHVSNPVPVTADVIAEGRDHFADHCAVCHANDGSGDTEMGRGLYPRAP